MILVRSGDRDSFDFSDLTLDFTLDFTTLRKFFSPEDFLDIFLFFFRFFFLNLPFLLVTSGWPHLQLTSPEPEPATTEPEPTLAAVWRTQDTEHLSMVMRLVTMIMMVIT